MLTENRQFEPTPHLFGVPVGETPLEFRLEFWHQGTLESLSYRMASFA